MKTTSLVPSSLSPDTPLFTSTLLARNTALNLIGQVLPLLVGVLVTPVIVHGLGAERFGLLALAWAVLTYFAIFDLGLGRATTKFVAEALGRRDEKAVPGIVWTAVTVQTILGLLGALVLVWIAPPLVERILRIAPGLIDEARQTFYVLAAGVPVLLVSNSFRGVLEAAQRFDLLNLVLAPTNASTFLLPALGLALHLRLPGIVALILLAKFLALVAFVISTFRLYPSLTRFSSAWPVLTRLFAFGGWVALSNAVIPLFAYLDRFLIGTFLGLREVAYYAVAYQIATPLLFLPASVVTVMFPVFSTLASAGHRDRLTVYVMRSLKYLVIAMTPATAIVVVFAEDILRLWIGVDVAASSGGVLVILSIAFFLNAIGYIPFALIQAVGRPEVIVKYHVLELPLYAGVAIFLILRLGIVGAALALCLRLLWTIPLFTIVCMRLAGVSVQTLSRNGTAASVAAGGLCVAASFAVAAWTRGSSSLAVILASATIAGYLVLVWNGILDRTDRDLVRRMMRRGIPDA